MSNERNRTLSILVLLFGLPKREVVLQQRQNLEGLFIHVLVALDSITGVIVRLLRQLARLRVIGVL